MRYLLMLLALLPLQVMASADRPVYPEADWADIEALRTALIDEGYTINKLHTNGNCYEIYGRNKAGKFVEIYFDTKTFAIVKAAVEK